MVTLGEVLSLATLGGAIMGKIWRLWVSRLLENAFAAIVHLQILSDTDAYTKLQPQSPCTFMQIFLYNGLLTQNGTLLLGSCLYGNCKVILH